jgi:phosphatidate phosphatase LPIN
VISDVDGTITKSDIFGNVLPLMGRDWSHSGVTTLFSNVASNGYDVLYLTSRAIGQANVTREFLHSIRQGSYSLPLGPVIMSPDGLIHSFKREVIDRRPQDFKIPALRDVRNLFPDDVNPFFAGFGNRDTDLEAYKAVGVPEQKIFIINPKGDIMHLNKTLKKTYLSLNDLVHEMFPPLSAQGGLDPEYTDTMYWKDPIDSIPLVDLTAHLADDEEDHDPLDDPLD